MNKYCLPIIKKNKNVVLQTIQENHDYDFYEIWLDYIGDLDEAFVKNLVAKHEKKLIFLFRRQKLETPQLDIKLQQEILSFLQKKNTYVDLDISQKDLLSFIKNEKLKIKLICSYHNYEHTPENEILHDIIEEIKIHYPEIIKIATYCKTESDAVRLLQLIIKLKEEKKEFIILGIGKFGTITRLAGALWGNAIAFAPKEHQDASAPGQLTKEEMETILSVIARNEMTKQSLL